MNSGSASSGPSDSSDGGESDDSSSRRMKKKSSHRTSDGKKRRGSVDSKDGEKDRKHRKKVCLPWYSYHSNSLESLAVLS